MEVGKALHQRSVFAERSKEGTGSSRILQGFDGELIEGLSDPISFIGEAAGPPNWLPQVLLRGLPAGEGEGAGAAPAPIGDNRPSHPPSPEGHTSSLGNQDTSGWRLAIILDAA